MKDKYKNYTMLVTLKKFCNFEVLMLNKNPQMQLDVGV